MKKTLIRGTKIMSIRRNIQLIVSSLLFSATAHAQLTKANASLSTILSWMEGFGATVITLAVMFVGYRMAFGAAQWKDVAPIFWGSVLVGSAAFIAPILLGTA
jgi:type IV secretion system protein VirB2